MSKENLSAKPETAVVQKATDAIAALPKGTVEQHPLQAESAKQLSSAPSKDYVAAFKPKENKQASDLTIEDSNAANAKNQVKNDAKPLKPGSLDSKLAPEHLAKAGTIADKTDKTNISEKDKAAESTPDAATKEKTIAVSMENKSSTSGQTKPNFTVKEDGRVEMNIDPDKAASKEVSIVLERSAGQLNPTKAQSEAANELVSYLSKRLSGEAEGKPPEPVVLNDKDNVVSRQVEETNKLLPPKQEKDLSPQTREQFGNLNRFDGSGGVDMPMSSSEGTGSFDTRQVPRQLNETDKEAALKEVLAGLFQPDEKAPYETIRSTSDGTTRVGRYGLSAEQLGGFFAALGDPPDPAKIDELIRTGKLPKEYGEKLKDPKFFAQLKEMLKDIQSGKVTTEALSKFLPKELQETIAGDLVEKTKAKVGEQPGVIAAAVLSGKSPENLTEQNLNSPLAQEAAKAGEKLYEIATKRIAQDSAQRNPGTDAGAGNVPEGSKRDLIAKALQLAGQPVTDSAIAAVNTIVEKESSWNPKAKNDWDSNAQAGIPSQGLMQTIPPTFKENAIAGYDKDITDPLSNLIAGIRYSTKRYGSVEEVVRRTKSGGKNEGY